MPKRRLTEEEELAQALKESQENSQEEEEEGNEPDAKRRSGGGGASDGEGEGEEESSSSESESDDSELDPFAAATDAPATVGGRAVGTSPADANGLLQVGATPAAGGGAPLSAAALVAAETAEANMTAAYIAQLQREDADEHDKATQDAIRKLQADENRQAGNQGGGEAGRWGGGGIPSGGGYNSPVANSLVRGAGGGRMPRGARHAGTGQDRLGPSAADAQVDVSREFERGRDYQEHDEYGRQGRTGWSRQGCDGQGGDQGYGAIHAGHHAGGNRPQQGGGSLHALAAEPVAPDIQVATSHAADEEMDLYINEGGEEVR